MVRAMSTPKQRQLIGYLRKLLCLSEDVYHDILWTWGVDSSKELTAAQAETLLNQLKQQAIGCGKYSPKAKYKTQKWKYNNYSDRDAEMVTPAQMRMIEGLWFEVSYQTNDRDRETALNKLCERITGKARLVFITKNEASKMIKAINSMKLNKEEKKICSK